MLTSRAKHAYDFEIIETHALIAIQFDWKRERERKKEQNEHEYNEKLNANRLTYAKLLIENENYNCGIKHKEEHAKQEDCDNEHRTTNKHTLTHTRTHRHTDKPTETCD